VEIVEEEQMDVIEIGNEKFLLFDFNGRYYCESNIFMQQLRTLLPRRVTRFGKDRYSRFKDKYAGHEKNCTYNANEMRTKSKKRKTNSKFITKAVFWPTTGLEFFLRGVDDLTPEEISRMKQYFRLNRAASRQEVAPLRVLTTVSQVVCL